MSRTIAERMADATVVALSADGSEWRRARLSGDLIPDKWMGLIQRRDGARQFVPSGEEPKCDRGDRLLLVRNRPISVPLGVDDVPAVSGHAVSASCQLLVRWLAREDDLASANTLLGTGELTLDGLARAVEAAGATTALRQFIRQNPAAKLIHEDVTDELLATLRDQLKRFLFETGLVLDGLLRLKSVSPSLSREEALQRQTVADLERIKARELVEQAAVAATARRLEGLSSVFEKLKTAAAGDQQMQWHDLLPTLSPAERGRLLENLWRITPDQLVAESLIIVAGEECLWLDPAAPDRIQRRVALPAELGGLRSVKYSAERRWLLVGAARGVWTIDARDGQIIQHYSAPNSPQPRTGFNSAAVIRDRIFATHSQLGAWAWAIDSPEDARPILAPQASTSNAIRAVTPLDDHRVALAIDNVVRLFDASGQSVEFTGQLPATVHCLTALDGWLYAGIEDGSLFGCHVDAKDGWVRLHRAPGLCESIQARRWSDLVELVVPGNAQGILGVFAQEGIVAQLAASPTPIRRAWACDDLLVGLGTNRDRLVVLNAHLPAALPREVPIARMIGDLAQDACIVTRPKEKVSGTISTAPPDAAQRNASAPAADSHDAAPT